MPGSRRDRWFTYIQCCEVTSLIPREFAALHDHLIALARANHAASRSADAIPEQTLQLAFALRDPFGVTRVVIYRVPFAVIAATECGSTQLHALGA